MVTVTVIDTITPIVRTQNFTAYLNDSGKIIVSPLSVNANSTDNCNISTYILQPDTFTCANLGANNVQLFVSDSIGNIGSSGAVVSILDTIKPKPVARNLIVYLNASGQVSITTTMADSASTDNCSIATRTIQPNTFTCTEVGNNTVYLSIIDQSGNKDSIQLNVLVIDTVRPLLHPRNITVYLDTMGAVSITSAMVDSASSDVCGIATRMVQPSTFSCNEKGNNTVVLRITDVNGNIDSALAIVMVVDTIKPKAIGKDITVYLNTNGTSLITGNDIDSLSSDQCSVIALSAIPNSFNCSNTGNNQVILRIEDNSGNIAFDTINVTVVDSIKPLPNPKITIAYLDATGNVIINGNQLDSASSDNCGIDTVFVTPNAFNCSDTGWQNVSFIAFDTKGNSASLQTSIYIQDTIRPRVILKDISVHLNPLGTIRIDAIQIDSATSDNCGIDTLILSQYDFNCNNVGVNAVTLTAIDFSGNISQQIARVTVRDSVSPIAISKNITVYLNSTGTATINANMVDSASFDNCAVVAKTLSKSTFDCSNLGSNTITLTVFDTAGNSSQTFANVSVIDTLKPNIISKRISTAYLDANGTIVLAGNFADSSSSDNCSIANLTMQPNTFNCGQLGINRVLVTAIDQSANSISDSASIMVIDTIRPKIICNPTIVLYTDKDSCGKSFAVLPPVLGSTDNCGIRITSDKPATALFPSGTTTIIWTATDSSGNASSCSQQITVIDTIRPLVITKNITAYLNSFGNVLITPSMVDSASSDNCGIDTMYISKATYNCADTGMRTATLFVKDINGNIASAPYSVMIKDTTRPVLLLRNVNTYLNAVGTVTIPTSFVDNGTFEPCGLKSFTLSQSTFTCDDVGANIITVTAIDASGNIATDTVRVSVFDTIKPNVVTKNIEVVITLPTNTASILPSDVDMGSTDACGIDSMWVLPKDFNIANLRTNIVTLFIRDKNGNISSKTAIVYVKELNPPVARCKNISVTLVNGKAIITPFMIDNGSSDETGIKQYTLSIDSFTCADIGKNTVTLTVTDSNDLSSSCTATVDVIGTIPVFSVLGELNKNGIFIGEQNIEVDSNQLFLGYGPQSFKLSCISTGNDTPFTYQWNGSGVTTPNAQNPIVVPTQEGTLSYQAIVTNKYGCTSSRSLELCVIDVRDPRPSKNNQKYIIICKLPPRNLPKPFSVSVPIDEVPALLAFGNKLGHCDSRCGGPTIEQLIGNPSSNSAVVFPNPASGSFNIQFQTPGMDKYVRVRLYDIRGELLYDNEYVDVFGVTSFGEELKSGLYIVEITEGGFNNIIKVIKLN